MIADHVTGQPARIAVPVLIDVLTTYAGVRRTPNGNNGSSEW
jgi:hypothetical protein